jgi:hypothetical protein
MTYVPKPRPSKIRALRLRRLSRRRGLPLTHSPSRMASPLMKKSTLTPQDKRFLITSAKSVDGIRLKQKTTETRLTTVEHNVHALYTRMNRMEAQLNRPGMFVTFKDLMPGFTKSEAQAYFFKHALHKLLDEFHVQTLEGRMDNL